MRIDKLILTGYKRFRLRQIHRLEYTPSKKTQVILGSNGSGKSSLMEELSPLPANSKDFDKGGGKEIWIHHRGKDYYLASLFTEEGNRFIFSVDGENQNPGLTVTVYRDLVKSHFNYTKEIHQLLVGKVYFHAMSVNERRNWFMALSDTDYTYAIAYFKRLKEKVRDYQSVLKNAQERLARAVNSLLSDADEKALQLRVQQLSTELSHLQAIRPGKLDLSNETSLAEMEQQLQKALDSFRAMLAVHAEQGSLVPTEALETHRNQLKTDILILDNEINLRLEKVSEIQQQLIDFRQVDHCSLADVLVELAQLETQIESTQRQVTLDWVNAIDAPRVALSALQGLLDGLVSLSHQYRDHPLPPFTRDQYRLAQDRLYQLNDLALKQQAQDRQLEDKVKQFAEKVKSPEVNCPKCEHHWIPNYDHQQHDQCQKEWKLAEAAKLKTEALLAEQTTLVGHMQSKLALHTTVSQWQQHWRCLAPFWQHLLDADLLNTCPDQVPSVVNEGMAQLEARILGEQAQSQKAERLKLKGLIEATQKNDRLQIEKVLAEENHQLYVKGERRRQYQKTLQEVELALKYRYQVTQWKQTIDQHLATRQQLAHRTIQSYITAAIEATILKVQTELHSCSETLFSMNYRKQTVEVIQVEIETIKKKLSLLQEAQTALSPTTGLIAKGMTGFINAFVESVNRFIAKIWLYPLEVVPIELEGEDELDLDYKFEIRVNGEKASPDIAETSSGMKEIINLAFVLASMEYLGLSDYPVFLDEFAVKMDAAHRTAAYGIIDYLVESSNFSQLFLISHYASGYSNLSNAEILVLCPSNITLPKHLVVNNHAQLH